MVRYAYASRIFGISFYFFLESEQRLRRVLFFLFSESISWPIFLFIKIRSERA